jgi:hypothetical protein
MRQGSSHPGKAKTPGHIAEPVEAQQQTRNQLSAPDQSLRNYPTIVAIDPSLLDMGVAVLRAPAPAQPHRLVHAGPCKSTLGADALLAGRCDLMVAFCKERVGHVLHTQPHAVVIEIPRINVVTRGGKADPADIIRLAVLVGALAQFWTMQGSIVRLIEPAQWKGQTPKDVTLRRCQAALQPDELARVELPSAQSKQHNVWDAVGIALWSVGRYG